MALSLLTRTFFVFLITSSLHHGELRATDTNQTSLALDIFLTRLERARFMSAGHTPDAASTATHGSINTLFDDNKRMVYQSGRDGNWEIYRSATDGSNPVRLTTDPRSDIQPRLSFDGQKIAFSSNRTGQHHIYVVNWDGSNLRQLTDSGDNTEPAWSPDGHRIAFVSTRAVNAYEAPRIYSMRADGSDLRLEVNSSSFGYAPDWHPFAGIVYVRVYDAPGSLPILETTGGNALTTGCRATDNPRYSFDGSHIAYECDSNNDGRTELHVRSPTGTYGLITAPAAGTDLRLGSWELDHKNLIYAITTSGTNATVTSAVMKRIHIDTKVVSDVATGPLSLAADARWNDTLDPIIQLLNVPIASSKRAEANWSGADNGPAGVIAYDMQYQIGTSGNWVDIRSSWPYTTANRDIAGGEPFLAEYGDAQVGETVQIRVRARDAAGNVPDWSIAGRTTRQTVIFAHALKGVLTDQRGLPIASQGFMITPTSALLFIPLTGSIGQFVVPARTAPIQSSVMARQGYLAPPETLHTFGYSVFMRSEEKYTPYLFGPDNLIANPSFEASADPLSAPGWQAAPVGDTQQTIDRFGANGSRGFTLWRNDGAGVFSISQTITIPAQMHQPTLSFLNRVVSRCDAFFVQGDAVSVVIRHGASTTTVFTRTVVDYADTGWHLHWVDLSPWRGMSVSLVFQLGSTSCHAFHIDDVAASAWRTPIITGIRPGSSQINTPVTLTVAGGNFISGSTILVNGEALSTTWVNSETLVATAPVGFAFGNYTVDVEQANSGPITTSPYKLLIGRMVFLPTITAN